MALWCRGRHGRLLVRHDRKAQTSNYRGRNKSAPFPKGENND
jgi:hypothetical protein